MHGRAEENLATSPLSRYVGGMAQVSQLTSIVATSLLAVSATIMADAPTSWMMWVEGDPPDWNGIVQWAGQTTLPCDKLVIRLIDPDAANGSGTDFKLGPGMNAPVLHCIKRLRAGGFTGEIGMLPYFDGNWVWQPDGATANNEWEKPFYWAKQANEILAAAGVTQGIAEINFENENSGGILEVSDAKLHLVQTFQATLWPQLSQSSGFVGLAATKGYTSALDMLRWTTTTTDVSGGAAFAQPPLASGMLELYNMYKCCPGGSDCQTTFVDAYSTPPQTPNPSPASPATIYTRAAAAADPVTDILGTATATCPAQADFGFLFGNKTPPCSGPYQPPDCMTGADMSRVWLMYSTETTSLGTIDAFGTWNAAAGSGASIETFKSFCVAFDDAFFTQYWNDGSPSGDAKPPRYGVFHLEYLPSTWKPNACTADLSGDGLVDLADILYVIDAWSTPLSDLNGDENTDVADLLIALSAYGGC